VSTDRHVEDKGRGDAKFIGPALRVAAANNRLRRHSSLTYPLGYDFVFVPCIWSFGARNAVPCIPRWRVIPRILGLRIVQRWPEDGRRKWEVIFAWALTAR
jgi:hypothetical protein